jgi:hypothetical protein
MLPTSAGPVYKREMAERGTQHHSTSRYVAIAALFTALEELMCDYHSSPEGECVQRWSEDAERITGEVARHLAIARARISTIPRHEAE